MAAQKACGFEALVRQQLHITRYFKNATIKEPRILFVAPTHRRVAALRKAFSSKPNSALYYFAAQTDLLPETFLTSPVWHPCVGEPGSLIKMPKGGGQ